MDLDKYSARDERLYELVQQIPGFLGIKAYVSEDGDRVSIARFESEDALNQWRFHPEHVETQQLARKEFYESYWVQVCKTIRDYRFSREEGVVHNPA